MLLPDGPGKQSALLAQIAGRIAVAASSSIDTLDCSALTLTRPPKAGGMV